MNEPHDRIADLVRAAGHRPELSPEVFERMRAATHAQWQADLRKRRRGRLLSLAAGIAVVGLGALLFSLVKVPGGPAVSVAQTEDGRILRVGDEIRSPASAGMTLTRLPDETAVLRMAANTHLIWKSAGEVELLAGAIYVDTGRQAGRDPLAILAGNARIEHVGTQFMAVRHDNDVEVSVRDGLVLVSLGNESRRIARGESAVLPSSGPGIIETARMDGSAADWQWVDDLAPSIAIEGRDLLSVLKALAYEGGVELRFANPGVEAMARTTTLHGPALDLPPREAMRALLTSSGLRMTGNTDGGSVEIDAL